MAVRIGIFGAFVVTTALAACGGGGSGDSTTPTQGVADPGSIVGADADFVRLLSDYRDTLAEPLFVQANIVEPPTTGSATFTGVGRVYDASLNTSDTSAAALAGRLVVGDVNASINFADPNRTLTATQGNFIDVNGAPISGTVTWTGTCTAGCDGRYLAGVSGDVGGTQFSRSAGQASVLYLSDSSGDGISGLVQRAPVTASGWLQGTQINADFVAK